MNYQLFIEQLKDTALSDWAGHLPALITQGLDTKRFANLPRWLTALEHLANHAVQSVKLNHATVSVIADHSLSTKQLSQLKTILMALHPWRKGPYNVLGIPIDTEWRSDWKWERLTQHIRPLTGQRVLDVGCGNGYHTWRARGTGAHLVMGIDPSPLFVVQFWALQHYINDHSVSVLPMRCEQLPPKLHFFDTTFSMGVLYHRRSPIDHLIELRNTLRHGGQLVLETLIVEGEASEVLVPQGRYGRMNNVWFIPSCAMLVLWLKKVGFKEIHIVDVSTTTCQEQRRTEWMQFYSLAQFLDPQDHSKTVEGYPAPNRAILTAIAP